MQKQEFEVHLTADFDHYSKTAYRQFKMICTQLGAKPLEILLERGAYPRQMMLSKVLHESDLASVLTRIEPWIEEFKRNKIKTIRVKVELPFQHSSLDIPAIDYYEWHALIEYRDILALKELCEVHQIHFSHNALTQHAGYRFLTLRETGSAKTFLTRLQSIKTELFNQNRVISKERLESCVYDTNIDLDRGWLCPLNKKNDDE